MELAFATLPMIIRIQRTDTTYDSVDFDDPMSIISYFKKLCQVTLWKSEEEADFLVDSMMTQIMDKETRDDSLEYAAKAISVMILTAKEIHGALQELGRDDDYSTAKTRKIGQFISRVMEGALERLLELRSSPQ